MPGDKFGCHVKDRTLSMMEVHPKLIQLRRERMRLHPALLGYNEWMKTQNQYLNSLFNAAKKTKAKL